MGTLLVAGRSEGCAAGRGKNAGALSPRPGFDGSQAGFDSAAGPGRIRFGVCRERRNGDYAGSAGGSGASAYAGNANGATARSAMPREGLRADGRRKGICGRDGGLRPLATGRHDYADAFAAVAIRTAGHNGGAGDKWRTAYSIEGVRCSD